jgi:hypothetical protein
MQRNSLALHPANVDRTLEPPSMIDRGVWPCSSSRIRYRPQFIYRGLRVDRRTFIAEFLLAAAARFDGLRTFTREGFEGFLLLRKTFEALRRRTSPTGARASCGVIAEGAPRTWRFVTAVFCAWVSAATVAGIKALDVV